MSTDNDGMAHVRRGVSIGIVAALGALAAGCSADGTSAPLASSSSISTAPPPSTTSTVTSTPDRSYTAGRHDVSFDVGGVRRTGVVVIPTDSSHPAPLVFVFHGHGGNGAGIERKMQIEELWPAAIVVYPDGLVGHQGITDPQGTKPGWQTRLGERGDGDIRFYDTMLATLRSKLSVDPERVYLMGHSNGSAFVSLLLNRRGDAIAATANLSAQPPARLLESDPVRSMFMSMGMRDPIVPYDNQTRSIPLAEQKLGVDRSRATVSGYLRSEPARGNLELETYVYPGGHAPPAEVPRLVVEFFKRHTRSGG
jgi:polyhydroxybutyrate depolymerase